MDPGAAAVTRVARRLSGLATLCLGFSVGTVRVEHGDDSVVQQSGRFSTELLAAAAARLDGEVVGRGLPRAIGDLSDVPVQTLEQGGARDGQSMAGVLRPQGSYAGVPVHSGGQVVGVISVTDPVPRSVGRQQIRVLVEFARLLADQLLPISDGKSAAGDDDAAAEIMAALAAGELRPWYQPIVDLCTERIVGVEALARWHRPGGAVEAPASFLPVAERSDLVLDIDRTILAQALTDLARWQQVRPDFRVSVNLSGRHLDRPELLSEVDAAAGAVGVAAASIDLEITETARPADLDTGREVLALLRERGYTVWFDDFGSGWSALQDLISLPVGGIKLDRSFADHLGTPVDDAVIAALTTAADQVGFKVTIEGIEQRHQVERARALGCHYAQGHWWSRACPAEDVMAMLSG